MLELLFFVLFALSFALAIFPTDLGLTKARMLNAEPEKICRAESQKENYLNVFSDPMNGKVVAKLKNGTMVRVEGEFIEPSGDYVLFWLQISIKSKGKWRNLGWVLSGDLNCNE